MLYAMSAVTVILCFFLARITLDHGRVQKIPLLCARNSEEGMAGKQIEARTILLLAAGIMLCAAVTAWQLTDKTHDLLNATKLLIAMLCLVGGGCVDLIERRIPNVFSGVLAIAAVGLLALGYITEQNGAVAYITSSVFAAAASAACLTIGSFLSHGGIGMGDIKLIAALALMGGVNVTIGTMFCALVLCALVACYLLLSKKKTIKEGIPFGPFILIGYMITINLLRY